MDAGQLIGRGMSFPPRLGPDGRVAWSEGSVNVREAIRVILLTNQQERLMLPEFGGDLSAYFFEPNTVTTRHLIADRITKALAAWEPRVTVDSVQVDLDPSDEQAAIATITYRLVATGVLERVSVGITLAS